MKHESAQEIVRDMQDKLFDVLDEADDGHIQTTIGKNEYFIQVTMKVNKKPLEIETQEAVQKGALQ